MTDHHSLDMWPLPREKKPMFINEPWLIDSSIYFDTMKQMDKAREPDEEDDNCRVHIPLDLNKAAFLRRLHHTLDKYPDITWKNERLVYSEVHAILAQIEIYDQLWIVREGEFSEDENGMITRHSHHVRDVIREIVARLEEVDTCEDFPYDIIDELKSEYDVND